MSCPRCRALKRRESHRCACSFCRTEWGSDSPDGKAAAESGAHLLEIFDGDVVLHTVVTDIPPEKREVDQAPNAFLQEVRGHEAPLGCSSPCPAWNGACQSAIEPEASSQLWKLVFSEPSAEALRSLDTFADSWTPDQSGGGLARLPLAPILLLFPSSCVAAFPIAPFLAPFCNEGGSFSQRGYCKDLTLLRCEKGQRAFALHHQGFSAAAFPCEALCAPSASFGT